MRKAAAAAAQLVLSSLAGSLPAQACPDCQLGREVRRRIVGDDFWSNLAAVLLPLVILGIIAVVIHKQRLGGNEDFD